VKDSASRRGDLIAAIIALIDFAVSYLMMFCNLVAFRASNTIRKPMGFNPFKASIIIQELMVKIFHGISSHFVCVHCLLPPKNYNTAQGVHDVKG
jgi:hypothetical protein